MRYIALLLIVFSLNVVWADTNQKELLKSAHMEKLLYYGHAELLKGTHQFFQPKSRDNKTRPMCSIYAKENLVSFYTEEKKHKLYCIVKIQSTPQGTKIDITHKINKDFSAHTLKYSINFSWGEKAGFFVNVDKHMTDLRQPDLAKILICIAVYLADLGFAIYGCVKNPDKLKCALDIIKYIIDNLYCILYPTPNRSLPKKE